MKQKRKFTVLIEQDEDGYYVATVPALHGCHTQAKNLDALMKRVREVSQLCLEEQNGDPGSLGQRGKTSSVLSRRQVFPLIGFGEAMSS